MEKRLNELYLAEVRYKAKKERYEAALHAKEEAERRLAEYGCSIGSTLEEEIATLQAEIMEKAPQAG